MSLLAPLGLLFLLAITVPIIIHLLNPDKGKRVLLGSIQFLEKVKPTQQPSYRIKHWLLLLLRCLLVVLLALLLARWTLPMTIGNKSYVLVPKDWPAHFSEQQQSEFEQLQFQGAEVAYFEGGFETVAEILAGLPLNAEKSIFLANDAAYLPAQILLSDSHHAWHIAQSAPQLSTHDNWLLLFSADTQLLAQRSMDKLKVLSDLTLTAHNIDSDLQSDEKFTAIINLSPKALTDRHYKWLEHGGQVFTHYQTGSATVPEAAFHSDSTPVTYNEVRQNIPHTFYNVSLLTELERWLQQPWFALSMVSLVQQNMVQGTIANNVLAKQLNNQKQPVGRNIELHWPLLMMFMLLWLVERFLSVKIAQETDVK